MAAAHRALPAARAASEGDHARLSTAARSIHNACLAKNLPVDWLQAISPPAVIHYAGHIIAAPGAAGRFPATAEATVAARISELLAEHNVGFGYGSLAAGADILFAEALLARRAQLHVLLPFRLDDFIRESVQPAGQQWITRFEACLANAKSVFRIDCPNSGCIGGDFDLTEELAKAVAEHRTTVTAGST